MIHPPPSSTLFPYTTLFRSERARGDGHPLPLGLVPGGWDLQRGWRAWAAVALDVGGFPPHRQEADEPRQESLGLCGPRSEEHTSELQSRQYLVCRLLLEKKN